MIGEATGGMKVLIALATTPVKLNATRIAEALVIASVTAAATGYVAVQVLDERVRTLDKRLDAVEKRAEERYGNIQEDVRRIYTILASDRPDRRTPR